MLKIIKMTHMEQQSVVRFFCLLFCRIGYLRFDVAGTTLQPLVFCLLICYNDCEINGCDKKVV